jgi:hypothetical protein
MSSFLDRDYGPLLTGEVIDKIRAKRPIDRLGLELDYRMRGEFEHIMPSDNYLYVIVSIRDMYGQVRNFRDDEEWCCFELDRFFKLMNDARII